MASVNEFPATGKILAVRDGTLTFNPDGTKYELHLRPAGAGVQPVTGTLIQAVIRVVARKIWTVPSGGNFITPLFGPPRIIQGRIRYLEPKTMVVQAGTRIAVELPAEESAYDLRNGPLAVGALVNVTALPEATLAPCPAVGPQRP